MIERKLEPDFCIITPTAYLERYASQSTMHLVLAHLVATDGEYANFYKHVGGLKIMDNGAFELGESYDPNRLAALGSECRAHVIVLPDYPFQPSSKTVRGAVDTIDSIRTCGFSTMFVPQSETGNLDDWIEGYRWAADNDDIDIIGMSILGMPNAIPHVHKAYARVVLTQILIERGYFNFNKYHHYLGLNSGPALEIPSLLQMNALDSCDSSGPVWSALMGHAYSQDADSYQGVEKLKVDVDFDHPLTQDEKTLERIQHNIDMTLSLFK